MEWSPSAARTFLQCPRKWFFREKFADKRSNNPQRQEAYFLNELSTIRALRGKVVDRAITRYAIPRFNRHEKVDQDGLLSYGRKIFQDQFRFAQANSFRTSSDSKFRDRPDYCALFEIDYGLPLSEDTVKKASDDVETSLRNFMRSEIFERLSEDQSHAIAQRTLKFHFGDLLVNSTPDLIVFSKSRSPFIVDWKVELPFYKEHWLQLLMYAYALSKVTPHKDFPTESRATLKDPTNTDLLEFQLLHNQINHYKATEDDIVDLENYVYASVIRMSRFEESNPAKPLDPTKLPTTFRAGLCSYCNFRKICWSQVN